jgi:hypothetical protein
LTYRTDEKFEVDLEDLKRKLEELTIAGVVLASLFGADNTCPSMLQQIREVRPDILVVLDDCQNLLLNRTVTPDARSVVVFSFNMKTIAGAMGGGVCLPKEGPNLQYQEHNWLMALRLECAVAMVILRQNWLRTCSFVKRLLGFCIYDPPGLEYSYAEGRIHYDMTPQSIARFSLVRAIVEMWAADHAESIRTRKLKELRGFLERTGAGEIVLTSRPESAPFVPVRLIDSTFLTRLPWKGPYALEGHPRESLRSELVCFKMMEGANLVTL